MAEHETFDTIRDVVADSLAVDQDEVRLESRLVTDLGADSLDFIDLIFTLEKRFGVKIRQGELDFLSKLDVSNPKVMREGFLAPDALQGLLPWLPALRAVPDLSKVTPAQLFSFITVETLCIMVERKLAAPEVV
jgi:acyl carrier protein